MEATKKELRILLRKKLVKLLSIFGERQIFGVFIAGKINYQKISDYDEYPIQIVYIPGLEELSTLNPTDAISLPLDLSMNCNFIDFRQYLNSLRSKLDILTESIYNHCFVINPFYEKILKRVLPVWKDYISTYHQQKRINYLLNKSKGILEMIPQSKQNVTIALFLYYIADGINQQVPYESFFYFKENYPFQNQSLYDLSNNNIPEIQIANIYDTLREQISNFEMKVEEKIPSKEVNFELEKTFKDIFKASLRDTSYCSFLTELEQEALGAVKAAVGEEGCFSTTKLIEQTGISRVVFTNLLRKMKECSIAEVQSRGVKGTYVKFY